MHHSAMRKAAAIASLTSLLLLATGLTVPPNLHAQSQTAPAFSVSSIKRNDSVNANSSQSFPPGGRFSARFVSLRRLILTAYRIKDYQLSGGPNWINSERYDIDTRAEDNASRDQVLLMIQRLLAERFQLNVHREKRELPAYTLGPGKTGMRLEKAPDRPTNGFDTGTGRIAGYGVSMAALAEQLSQILDRPVIDKTGMSGSFDLKVQYSPVEASTNVAPTPNVSTPDIFTAIEEQLGLRLEAMKASIDVLVIDHAEKPSEN